MSLAGEGGYDAVQMREVAATADVALGTLYRYFPSKEHLLASAMVEQVRGLRLRLDEHPPEGTSAAERVVDVLQRATRALQRNPNATAAMIRATVSAEPSMAPVVAQSRREMSEIITSAIHRGSPSERDLVVSRILEYMWLASLASWVNGLDRPGQVVDDLSAAARLLLDGQQA